MPDLPPGPAEARVTAQERRERQANIATALRRLADHPKFRLWRVDDLLSGETVEEVVDRDMRPENLRVERQRPDRTWEEWND